MAGKKRIYYARTYRRIDMDWIKSIIYACLIIIPCFLLIALNIDTITGALTDITVDVLSKVIEPQYIRIHTSEYSIMGEMYYVSLLTTHPTKMMSWCNLCVCLFVMLLLRLLKRSGNPIAIFANFSIFVHIISCLFFILIPMWFPYTIGDYSDIYLKQQIGIWLTFVVLAGMMVAFFGNRGYIFKTLIFLCIILYSVLFGSVRYILYLFLLHKFSVLYMALLFFVVGPMFDFSYFVAIYALFVNKNIKDYSYGEKKGIWKWS